MGAFSQRELEYLKEQALAGARGYIATVSRKQNPQLTPVGYVADEERIYSNIKHDSVRRLEGGENPRSVGKRKGGADFERQGLGNWSRPLLRMVSMVEGFSSS
jgi:hypothetical protein